MQGLVRYEFADGIATLTMDDGKANAMGIAMLQAIDAALDRAQDDQAVVVLAGRERMFSGGFDLAVFKGEPEALVRMLEAGARLTRRLLAFPRPVLAVCTGHAIAMGAFVLLSADVRLGVDQGARIQVNEVQIGLTLPRFAIEVCRQRLAPEHLTLAAVTALPYAPQQAVVAGFLDEVVPAAALADATSEGAARLAKLDAPSFAATKLRLRHDTLARLDRAIADDVFDWQSRFGRCA